MASVSTAGQRVYNGLTADERQAQRRTRLLKAARSLLADGDARNLTVTGVCQAAKLSERYFYESFANREALIDALFEDIVAVATGVLEAAARRGDSPEARTRALIEGLVDLMLSEPRLSVLAHESQSSEVITRGRAVTARALAAEIAARATLFWPTAGDRASAQLAGELGISAVADVMAAWHVGELEWSRDELVARASRFFLEAGGALAGTPG